MFRSLAIVCFLWPSFAPAKSSFCDRVLGQIESEKVQKVKGPDIAENNSRAMKIDVDLDNDTKPDSILAIVGSSTYQSGSYLLMPIPGATTKPSELGRLLVSPKGPDPDDEKNFTEALKTHGYRLIPAELGDSSYRYIWTEIFRFEEKTYLLSKQDVVRKVPYAKIYEISRDGKLKTVCTVRQERILHLQSEPKI